MNVPLELRDLDQWVVWWFVERDDRMTKVPFRSDGGGRASTTDPTTWSSYESAVAGAEALAADGIGYVFSADDPFVGVDLDDKLTEAERDLIALALNSYTERSISGLGLHVILRASLNGRRRRAGGFEVYDSGRFFVMTGDHDELSPRTIEDRQAQLDAVLEQYLPPEPERRPSLPPRPVDLDDQALLEKARRARNGSEFQALWAGEWEGRYPSQSEADLRFCSLLAFWFGCDPERMSRVFRASGLYRAKWERDEYRVQTIFTAIAGCNKVYEPGRRTA